MLIVLASNYLVQFPFQYFQLSHILTWGAFTYPIAFLVTDIANRLYGFSFTRKIIFIGFVWGVGVSYKNEIDLWTEDGSFFTDKIFSKPKGYRPQYKIRDLNGNERVENGEQSEQFINMFSNFLKIMNDKKKAVTERKSILQRAKLMNDIVNF